MKEKKKRKILGKTFLIQIYGIMKFCKLQLKKRKAEFDIELFPLFLFTYYCGGKYENFLIFLLWHRN